jgi:hypothetical protein
LKESDLYANFEKGGGWVALTIVSREFRGGQELLVKVQIRYGTLHHSVSSCPSGSPAFSRRCSGNMVHTAVGESRSWRGPLSRSK